MIQIVYNGQDITDNVSINRCWHDMYAQGSADTLTLIVGDAGSLWDSWGPAVGDTVQITYGSITTGKMHVNGVSPMNGLFTITARSAPASCYDAQYKAWSKIRLLQIGQEIADRHGLTFKSYGVTDHLYNYILQNGQNDLSFLARRAKLESCSFLIYDGALILYDEKYMESQTASETITIGQDGEYRFYDDRAKLYGSCKLEVGGFSGEYTAGNGSNRILTAPDDIYVGSNEEAARFAQGLLRAANNGCCNGWVKGRILPGYAAASMASLECSRASSWNGPVFLYHIRNDYAAGETKLFFRRPLEGY